MQRASSVFSFRFSIFGAIVLACAALMLNPVAASAQNTPAPTAASNNAKPLPDDIWRQLERSRWITDGSKTAPRTVYVFSDPNCPYCNKLWADARPWVDAGKVQLRHIIVGILTPTSAGKAAALLTDKDPVAMLERYERSQGPATAAMLASGKVKAFSDNKMPALSAIPDAIQAQLDSNAKLMYGFGYRATPVIVWRDPQGKVQVRAGAPSGLQDIFGARKQ